MSDSDYDSVMNISDAPVPPLPKVVFVPEINYWGLQVITKSPIYQDFKQYPVSVKESEWRRDGSILDLLFNYTFDYPSYSIHYIKVPNAAITDVNINQRATIRASQLLIYVCDSSSAMEIFPDTTSDFGMGVDVIDDLPPQPHCPGIPPPPGFLSNVFRITTGERDLIDLLFLHKSEVNVSTILAQIDYNKLPSPLSKLIYIYLDIEINNNYFLYDNDVPVTDQNRLIVWMYEKYVMDHLYRKLMLKPAETKVTYFGPTDSTSIEPRLQIIDIETKTYHIQKDKPPLGEDYLFLVHGGLYQVLHKDYEYQVTGIDTTSVDYFITWQGKGLETSAQINDKIYLLWGYTMEEVIDDVQCR